MSSFHVDPRRRPDRGFRSRGTVFRNWMNSPYGTFLQWLGAPEDPNRVWDWRGALARWARLSLAERERFSTMSAARRLEDRARLEPAALFARHAAPFPPALDPPPGLRDMSSLVVDEGYSSGDSVDSVAMDEASISDDDLEF